MKKFHNCFYIVIKLSFLHVYISSHPEINNKYLNVVVLSTIKKPKIFENFTSVVVGTVTLRPHVGCMWGETVFCSHAGADADKTGPQEY